MMLTIHGLPTTATYKDLKRLVKQECNINDFILDNLVTDTDGSKKVRIGVTDDSDGSQLMKFLNGFHWSGSVLRIVPVGKAVQPTQPNFDSRPGFQPRNDYHSQPSFGSASHDTQLNRQNTWAPNNQWGPGPTQQPQNVIRQPQQPVMSTFVQQQQPRGQFPAARAPMPLQHQQHQNFTYPPRSHNIPEHTGQAPYEQQPPVAQAHFQAPPHAQSSPWDQQVPPVKTFDKPPGSFNQQRFSDNHQMPKQGLAHGDPHSQYKGYDKGDRRFEPQAQGPGMRVSPRRRMSPEIPRRMSPSGMRGHRLASPSPQGRRMSPTGPQGRRMSPGHQGRRMSPTGVQGRRMSPQGSYGRRMSPTASQGRRISPSGVQGRRISPSGLQGRRMSPSGPHARKPSPTGPMGRRVSPVGPHGRRMDLPAHEQSGRRASPLGAHHAAHVRRMSPTGRDPTGPAERRVSPGRQRRMSPPRMGGPVPTGRGLSPPSGRRISPSRLGPGPGRTMSPTHGRKMSPVGRRISPGRRMSPGATGRAIPPGVGRRVSPGREMPPAGSRRMSPGRELPSGVGRRMSPGRELPSGVGRRMSPGRELPSGFGRRMSPGRELPSGVGRRISPRREMPPGAGRRLSPGREPQPGAGRRMSPGRQMPPERRISPSERRTETRWGGRSPPPANAAREYPPSYSKPKYDDDERSALLKQVRPAYEPTAKAANQAMYSGGYRPNVHESVQYQAPGVRSNPWLQGGDKPAAYSPSNMDGRTEKFDISRVSEHLRAGEGEPKRSRSRNRDSRSPIRRDRSPLKDRYRRHSPSPRSPRRSWALEKRRSPDIRDAPPPPVWPGQTSKDPAFPKQSRQSFSDMSEKIDKKHVPTWDRPAYEERDEVHRRGQGSDAARRPLHSPAHGDKWKPVPEASPKEPLLGDFRQDGRFVDNMRDSRYDTKEEFIQSRALERPPYSDKRDIDRDYPMKKDDRGELRHKKDIPLRREDFVRGDDRRELFRSNPTELNKEIEDVYKRVVELSKKAQEYRKKESRFEDRVEKFYDHNEESMSLGRGDVRDYSDARFQARNEDKGPRHDDDPDRSARQRESRWSSNTEIVWRTRKPLTLSAKTKRDKAAEELAKRTMNRFKTEVSAHQKDRVFDELKLSYNHIFYNMFKDEDVSFIEIIIKFNKSYDSTDEAKIFEEVISSFSSGYRKRSAADESGSVPAKTAKRSPDGLNKDIPKAVEFQNAAPYEVPQCNLNPVQPVKLPVSQVPVSQVPVSQVPVSQVPVNQLPVIQRPTVAPPLGRPLNMPMPYAMNPPIMVQAPSFLPPPHLTFEPPQQPLQPTSLIPENGYKLFLCKDGFKPYDNNQAEQLKSFLVSQMLEESEKSDGWAPDFIMKGLQGMFRYEIVTEDKRSKEWLLDLDFSKFTPFNVLVSTGEQLTYERAAIWLPGHSRCRHIEPLKKLKLQNKKLAGVHVGKWNFVKKVVIVMGTRIYVDMPSASARALENHKMMLSYELQKVSVFMKSAAVDKAAFDAGLNEPSIDILPSLQNTPMPSLNSDPNVIKIGIKGNKHTNLSMARKIKDMIVYRLYHYLQQGGNSSTDFLKYGFCSPGALGVVPENTESKRWLVGLNIGTLHRQPIVVLAGDEVEVKYLKMYVLVPIKNTLNTAIICEKLKQSNQGVKGINFGAWKNAQILYREGNFLKLKVEMDLESVETIAKMDYELDFVDEGHDAISVAVESDYSHGELDDIIKQYRAEQTDTYDVANMDIESDSEDDVICLD